MGIMGCLVKSSGVIDPALAEFQLNIYWQYVTEDKDLTG
jgi:hypothetical protein